MRLLAIVVTLMSSVAAAQDGADSCGADCISVPHLGVNLVSDHDTAKPGENVRIGVRFFPEEGWHVYWRNPGDSGLPPDVRWRTRGDVHIGPVEWPFPHAISAGPVVTYGYHEETFLLTRMQIPENAPDVELSARVSWVVCREECIPGEGEVRLKVRVDSSTPAVPSKWAAAMNKAEKKLPVTAPWLKPSARLEGGSILLTIAPDSGSLPEGAVRFFPYEQEIIDNSAGRRIDRNDAGLTLHLPVARKKLGKADLEGVIVAEKGWPAADGARAVEISVPISGAAEAQRFPPAETPAAAFTWVILLTAFLGGLILNLMPCVFPVLSIKVLSFIENLEQEARTVRIEGLAYGAGVVAGFWILAGLLLLLKDAGLAVGWGFQLQYPEFVVLVSFLLLAMALNLFGVFHIGQTIQSMASTDESFEGTGGSFFNGLLATAVATPCTAPFMGAAIAVALSQPWHAAFLVFTSLGLGMAFPYVLLSWFPELHRVLPKPGGWMSLMRKALAFPLFMTVAWLTWIFHQQTGASATISLLWGYIGAGLILLIYGKLQSPSHCSRIRNAARLFTVIALLSVLYSAIPGEEYVSTAQDAVTDAYGFRWEKYSREKLAAYRAQGKPVFIDFTAAWCLTCRLNKGLVFGSEDVRRELQSSDLVLLRADWTSRDAAIAEDIGSYGRSGVPLNVLYSRDPAKKPFIFPSLLTAGIVLEALNRQNISTP